MEFQNGIDRLLTGDFGLRGKRLGLITSATGLSASLVSSADVLRERFTLSALFGPEHGIRGDIMAGDTIQTYTDPATGLPVYSLYGGQLRPTPEMLDQIDMLLIDIQDVGSRFYTYISTMYNAMEECAKAGKTFVVLDRQNPISGTAVEGNILDLRFKSFVGIAPIPQRHGMTMGELALFFNDACGIHCDLKIVPLSGWKREWYGEETGMPWVNPSPNITGVDCALLYTGTCIFEATNISEGRGTTKPFEYVGAPWLDAEKLAKDLNALKLPGFIFRPAYFTPGTEKFKDELCRGIQIHVVDRKKAAPVKAAFQILELIREQDPARFIWNPPVKESHGVDRLTGSDLLRLGKTADYYATCEEGAAAFLKTRQPYLLY